MNSALCVDLYLDGLSLKEHSTFFGIGSFYTSPRVKKLRFTVFESIQPISGSGGSTFSLV